MKIIIIPFNLAFILIAICCNCFAQGQQFQNNNWYFGDGATMYFPNANSPIVGTTTSQLYTTEGSASISDINGNLLFYTDGGTVWDANDAVMPNGNNIQGYVYGGSSTQSCIILKQPVIGLYYIFTVSECGVVPHNFSYTIVNMALNGGLGDVVVASKNVIISDSTTEKIAATYVCADPNRLWVLTHEFGSAKFVARALTAAGIGSVVTTSIGPVINNALLPGASDQGVGSMKFSHDGLKIAICNNNNPASLDLYDFDKATGYVSNRLDLYDIVAADAFYGLEFSPNNQYLYVTNGNDVSQYDISSGVAATIKSSRVAIGTPVSGAAAVRQVQLAPDGKIYCAQTKNSTFLGIINNPNVAGAGCNWDLTGFDVDPGGNGFKPRFGLPSQLIVIPTQFTYQGTPDGITLCKSNTAVSPTMLSSYPVNNGDFTTDDPVGLVINSVTGAIDVATSTIGTYVVEFTAPLSGCNTPFLYDYTVDIIDCNDGCKVQNHSFEYMLGFNYTNWQNTWTGGGFPGDTTETNPQSAYGGVMGTNYVAEIDAEAWLQQSVSGFVIGNSYSLSFLASRRTEFFNPSPNPTVINVKIDGGVLTTTATRTNTTFALTAQSYNFIATQTTHVLSLRPTAATIASGITLGMLIDDIDICPLIVLPIELTEFNGVWAKDYSELYWETATEINNDYFILQKSDDATSWRDIAKIKGAGNSTQQINYSFNDYELSSEIMYYRLLQVDFDGKKTNSQIVTIQHAIDASVFTVFPNQSNGIYNIKTNEPVISYEVVDNLGRIVCNGTSPVVDIQTHASGIYYLKIKLKKDVVIKKIIKNDQ